MLCKIKLKFPFLKYKAELQMQKDLHWLVKTRVFLSILFILGLSDELEFILKQVEIAVGLK